MLLIGITNKKHLDKRYKYYNTYTFGWHGKNVARLPTD
jgi:hypothetical protein